VAIKNSWLFNSQVWKSQLVTSGSSVETCGSPLLRSMDSNTNEILIKQKVTIPHSERALKAEFHTSLDSSLRQVNLHGVILDKTSRYWGLSNFSISMFCSETQQSACTSRAEISVRNRVAGLPYKRYAGMSWLGQPTATGVHTNIANMWTSGTEFSVEYNGFFYTGQYEGVYTFFCSSDDFSQVSFIDEYGISQAVCTAGCCSETSGTINLAADVYHKINIRFNQGNGPSYLYISFSHALLPKRTDGNGFYYHAVGSA
jgi:hypothetical protein